MTSYAWLPKNAEARVASTRIRCINTLSQLRTDGFPIELYKPRHAANYHAVIFSKAYKPKHVKLAEQLKRQGSKIVFDLCDNHFLLEEGRGELRQLFELADHWVVSSDNLATVVKTEMGTGKPLTVIEDAVEETLHGPLMDIHGRFSAQLALQKLRGQLEKVANQRGSTPLVWFGNHKASYGDAGMQHLNTVKELLADIHREKPITLTVISNSRESFDNLIDGWPLPTFYLEWNAHNFMRALQLHRIAIIPIDVNAFTAAKTNNRIALSLAQGLGVVADSIESYRVFSECASLDNWREGLLTYLREPAVLGSHITMGQAIIRRDFNLPVIAARWKAVLEGL
ncbi:hypothetical protein [Porticoccus sp.]